jgi:two-component system alkaline phosphatase synthesis response regulator PhoP
MARRVLVVDDEASILKLVATRLRLAGYEVTVAMDGQMALMKILEEPGPDLIVLDVMLPKLNGYEVCTTIRQNPRFKHVPIVMFTALREEQDYWKAMASGADAYLTKPYKAEDLEQLINRLIGALDQRNAQAGSSGSEGQNTQSGSRGSDGPPPAPDAGGAHG